MLERIINFIIQIISFFFNKSDKEDSFKFKKDLECKCGCKLYINNNKRNSLLLLLKKKLEESKYLNGEIQITSGCRCEKHNKEVEGSKNSQHLSINKCSAIDISLNNILCSIKVLSILAKNCMRELNIKGGIGLYDNIIHIDCRKIAAKWDSRTIKT